MVKLRPQIKSPAPVVLWCHVRVALGKSRFGVLLNARHLCHGKRTVRQAIPLNKELQLWQCSVELLSKCGLFLSCKDTVVSWCLQSNVSYHGTNTQTIENWSQMASCPAHPSESVSTNRLSIFLAKGVSKAHKCTLSIRLPASGSSSQDLSIECVLHMNTQMLLISCSDKGQ